MGGLGSGRGYRSDGRDTTESARSIDIRELVRKRWVISGEARAGTLTWRSSVTGEETSSVLFIADLYTAAPCLRLTYRSICYDGDETKRDYPIWLEATPCHLVGVRWWFRCVGCKRRCAILYSDATLYVCRVCANLVYSSSQDSRRAGLIQQLQAMGRQGRREARLIRADIARMRGGRPGRPSRSEAIMRRWIADLESSRW